MGRYFPLFREGWGVYFFARKSLVSGATVAWITRIRDDHVVHGIVGAATDRRAEIFPDPANRRSRRLVERENHVWRLNEMLLPLARRGRRAAPSSNSEIRALDIRDRRHRAILFRALPIINKKKVRGSVLRIMFFRHSLVLANLAFPLVLARLGNFFP